MTRTVPVTRTSTKTYFLDITGSITGTSGTPVPLQAPFRYELNSVVTYGIDIPDWKLNVSRGASATTSLDGVKRTLRFKEARLRAVARPNGPNYHLIEKYRAAIAGCPGHYFYPPPIAPSNSASPVAEQKAKQAFLASYLKESVAWRGGNTIAEFAETVRMLRHPVKALFNRTNTFVGGVGKLRKVYRRDPIDYGKALGDLWLGYALGIKPLVSDVNDAHAAIRALSEDLNSVDTKRIVGNGEVVTLTGSASNLATPGFQGTLYSRASFLVEQVRYLGAVKCRPPGAGSIAENFGVGFTDIVPAIWEAVPWSFIVDYFINIGEVLDSYKLAWADWAWLQRTVRNRTVTQYTAIRPDPSFLTDYDISVEGGQGYKQATWVNRNAILSAPFPSFQFSVPGTAVQFGNISALVAAIARSKPLPLFKRSPN